MTIFQKTVAAVKEDYPKFSPACLSLAMRSYETGVTLTARARQIALGVEGSERIRRRFCENRVKCVSFRCRLSPRAAEIVKDEMVLHGFKSQQEFLESLIISWVKESRPPIWITEERQGSGESNPSTSENITNL